jgi:hypothetical protein
MGILPRNDGPRPTAVMASINKINANIAQCADGKAVRYLNINDKLADTDGKLFEGMTTDRLHLSLKGYQVWADALKPLLTELLGPPAKEDHAPPPTGDPSAARKKPRTSGTEHQAEHVRILAILMRSDKTTQAGPVRAIPARPLQLTRLKASVPHDRGRSSADAENGRGCRRAGPGLLCDGCRRHGADD